MTDMRRRRLALGGEARPPAPSVLAAATAAVTDMAVRTSDGISTIDRVRPGGPPPPPPPPPPSRPKLLPSLRERRPKLPPSSVAAEVRSARPSPPPPPPLPSQWLTAETRVDDAALQSVKRVDEYCDVWSGDGANDGAPPDPPPPPPPPKSASPPPRGGSTRVDAPPAPVAARKAFMGEKERRGEGEAMPPPSSRQAWGDAPTSRREPRNDMRRRHDCDVRESESDVRLIASFAAEKLSR